MQEEAKIRPLVFFTKKQHVGVVWSNPLKYFFYQKKKKQYEGAFLTKIMLKSLFCLPKKKKKNSM